MAMVLRFLSVNLNANAIAVVPATIHDLGNGKARISLPLKPNKQYAVGVALADADNNVAGILAPFSFYTQLRHHLVNSFTDIRNCGITFPSERGC